MENGNVTQFREEYFFLSNMFSLEVPIVFEGIYYYSSENLYQAMKTLNMIERLKISKMSPYGSKKYASSLPIRTDWENVKEKVMYHALTLKFNQKPLRDKLLSIKGNIVEGNNHNDTFWGVCLKTGKGFNVLGNQLMYLRTNLLLEKTYDIE